MGIGQGDRVLLPTYHCPTMVAPAIECGATVGFYPINEQGTPDLGWLNSQDVAGVRALLVAHYFGLPQPMAAIRLWCDEKGIALIEDCAHALFGRSGERCIGAWGDFAIGSLTKFLPVPEGGCLVMNNGAAPPRLDACRTKSQIKAAIDILEEGARHGRLPGFNALLASPLRVARQMRAGAAPSAATSAATNVVDADFRIDYARAHRALSFASRRLADYLPRERIVQRRRQRFMELAERLAGRCGLRPLVPAALPPDCAPYMFPIWVDAPDPGYAVLRRLNTPVFRWDRLWPGTPTLPGDHGLDWSRHVIQVACHQDLTDANVDQAVDTLLHVYSTTEAPVHTRSPRAANSEAR
jgi:hypothetical protein